MWLVHPCAGFFFVQLLQCLMHLSLARQNWFSVSHVHVSLLSTGYPNIGLIRTLQIFSPLRFGETVSGWESGSLVCSQSVQDDFQRPRWPAAASGSHEAARTSVTLKPSRHVSQNTWWREWWRDVTTSYCVDNLLVRRKHTKKLRNLLWFVRA